VKAALAKNPSHAGLKRQCQLASLKQILIAYDLQSFNFAETTHAKELAFHILVQDRATAVEDALAVTEVYSNVGQTDVYLFRCCFLAENNRADKIVTLLRGITPVSVLDDVCERFVRYCSSALSDPLNSFRPQYADAARCLRVLLKSLSPDPTAVMRTCGISCRSWMLYTGLIRSLASSFPIMITAQRPTIRLAQRPYTLLTKQRSSIITTSQIEYSTDPTARSVNGNPTDTVAYSLDKILSKLYDCRPTQ